MSKPNPLRLTPEDLFKEATEEVPLTASELRLLSAGVQALQEAKTKPLNKIELKALTGMISYVAYTQKVNENLVSEVAAAHFGVRNIADLPARFYQNAIEYLVDLKMSTLLN